MDTQNNAKGGYGYGGSANNKAEPVTYMAGSKLSMSWTSQHSCGSENAECQIVIQYMCSPTLAETTPPGVPAGTTGTGEGPVRDGTNGNTPDPNNPSPTRGLHEPTSFYQACDNRERNKGLYTADQNLNDDDARRTRQNPNGARSGLECPEERDYYPYWAPSPWKDAMIMTNNLALCPMYQAESQNVKARGYCANPTGNGDVPNNPAGCTAAQGTWTTVPAHGIAAPECVAAPFQRDNHLGSVGTGYEAMANLTIPSGLGGIDPITGQPSDEAVACVYRLRYNITTADTRVCEDKTITTKAACEAAGKIWSAQFLDESYNDAVDNFNNNNPLPPTLTLPPGNPRVDLGGALSNTGGTDSLLELAINTNQYGRTFQDRTHVFSVTARPEAIPANRNIYNLNVKGKRGNIVQTYPATEYDFWPTDLVVGNNDLVHIQWTGNDNTNNNGNNNGEGTNNEDRHNIVQISEAGMDIPLAASDANMFDVQWEWNPEPPTDAAFGGARDQAKLTKQFALSKQTGCDAGNQNNDQARDNCEKLNSAKATIDMGLLQFKPGNFTYMSSRNNNFSNRAQKAKLHVLTTPTAPLAAPVNVRATPLANPDNQDIARMKLEWAPPGSNVGHVDVVSGQPVWGKDQVAGVVGAYSVQYTIDGGASWAAVENCRTTQTECVIDFLPAGTPVGFRVHSGNEAGWGEPSEVVLAKTLDSSTSLSCQQQLVDQMSGNYLSPGSVVAIVLGVFAALAALAFTVFMIRRRTPPPPPPPGMMKEVAPPGVGGGYA